MITLYAFGQFYGLPDMSPFVTKAEMLLKLAGLEYRTDTSGFSKAPKGKLPYIDDDGEVVADSTFIREHIEKKYGFDFDRRLNSEQRAISWAAERMIEEHLYWAMLHARWIDDENFAHGPMAFFQGMPFPQRLIVPRLARRQLKAELMGHGMGRHSEEQVVSLGSRSIDAVAELLGRKTFMMRSEPTGLDASAFAFMAGGLCPVFKTPLRDAIARHKNLKAYVHRMAERYYPDFPEIQKWAAEAS